jgi:hypothetical protein
MTLRITVETPNGLIAVAEVENIQDVSTMDYEVRATTFRSLDNSHGQHLFEVGNRRQRYDREQTVWNLVQLVANEIALREMLTKARTKAPVEGT